MAGRVVSTGPTPRRTPFDFFKAGKQIGNTVAAEGSRRSASLLAAQKFAAAQEKERRERAATAAKGKAFRSLFTQPEPTGPEAAQNVTDALSKTAPAGSITAGPVGQETGRAFAGVLNPRKEATPIEGAFSEMSNEELGTLKVSEMLSLFPTQEAKDQAIATLAKTVKGNTKADQDIRKAALDARERLVGEQSSLFVTRTQNALMANQGVSQPVAQVMAISKLLTLEDLTPEQRTKWTAQRTAVNDFNAKNAIGVAGFNFTPQGVARNAGPIVVKALADFKTPEGLVVREGDVLTPVIRNLSELSPLLDASNQGLMTITSDTRNADVVVSAKRAFRVAKARNREKAIIAGRRDRTAMQSYSAALKEARSVVVGAGQAPFSLRGDVAQIVARGLGFFGGGEEVQNSAAKIISGGSDTKDISRLEFFLNRVDGHLPVTLFGQTNESRMTGAQIKHAQRVSSFIKRGVSGVQLLEVLEGMLHAQLITTFQRDLENEIPSIADFETPEDRREFGMRLRARYGITAETTFQVVSDIESIKAEIAARPEDTSAEGLPVVAFPGGN